MKRKVLLIIGKSDLLIPGEYSFKTEKVISELQKREDIELVIVGRYDANEFDYSQLRSEISNLNSQQPLTVIVVSHGAYNNGFEFILDDKSRMSSTSLFELIGEIVQETPVDVFTTACHGGGMLFDKDLLPVGSTLVGLTDAEEVNNGADFDRMWEQFEEFNKNEITAYNLLQFYLSRCLKNRFHPHIGIAGNGDFSLNNLLRAHLAKPLDFDSNHFDMLGRPDSYKVIFDKIISGKSEWSIYANEYGIALSIILNDLKNKGCLNTEIINDKTK